METLTFGARSSAQKGTLAFNFLGQMKISAFFVF
jgi:hypothetical protein